MSSVTSHALRSPSVVSNNTLAEATPASSTVPLVDVEEVRKAAMHSAAERARLRRQQEEEEREKERERARKKAAELEAKINAAKQEKETVTEEVKAICMQLIQHHVLIHDLYADISRTKAF